MRVVSTSCRRTRAVRWRASSRACRGRPASVRSTASPSWRPAGSTSRGAPGCAHRMAAPRRDVGRCSSSASACEGLVPDDGRVLITAPPERARPRPAFVPVTVAARRAPGPGVGPRRVSGSRGPRAIAPSHLRVHLECGGRSPRLRAREHSRSTARTAARRARAACSPCPRRRTSPPARSRRRPRSRPRAALSRATRSGRTRSHSRVARGRESGSRGGVAKRHAWRDRAARRR